jgi:hypothetical protein
MKRKRIAIGVAALVVAVAAGYSIYWYMVAPRVDAAIDNWVAIERQAGLTLDFDRTPVSGFPWAFRATFHDPHAAGTIDGRHVDWQGPDLELRLSPFDLETIHLNAPGRHRFDLGTGETTFDAETLKGTIAFRRDGSLAAADAAATALKLAMPDGVTTAADTASLAIALPATPAQSDGDPAGTFSIEARNLTLPAGTILVTGDPLSRVQIAGSVKGPFPALPLRQALASWSSRGGTLEIGSFTLSQPPLTLSGSATLALDRDLQPIGAASMTARGLGETIDILAKQGRIAVGDALRFKLFVKGAQSPAPDGTPEVATGLSLQNGYLSWGPFRLARLSRIAWW